MQCYRTIRRYPSVRIDDTLSIVWMVLYRSVRRVLTVHVDAPSPVLALTSSLTSAVGESTGAVVGVAGLPR